MSELKQIKFQSMAKQSGRARSQEEYGQRGGEVDLLLGGPEKAIISLIIPSENNGTRETEHAKYLGNIIYIPFSSFFRIGKHLHLTFFFFKSSTF